MLEGKKSREVEVLDDFPVDARTRIPVFDRISLDAEADLVTGAEGIAHGVAKLVGHSQIGVPRIQIACLDGLARLLELENGVACARLDMKIGTGLPVRINARAVTPVIIQHLLVVRSKRRRALETRSNRWVKPESGPPDE